MKEFRILIAFCMGILLQSCSKDKVEEVIIPQNPPSSFVIRVPDADITTHSAHITWSESTDPEGKTVSYSLLMNGVVTAENIEGFTYGLEGLDAATEYNIEIIAIDGDEQNTSVQYSFVTKEEEVVEEQENLLFVEADVNNITFNSVMVMWAVATAPTDKTITYDIYLDDTQITTGMVESWYEFINLDPTTEYSVIVRAKAKDGKVSSETIVFTTLATPPNPSPFTLTVEEVSTYFATIGWTESKDPDEGAILYDVYLDEVMVVTNTSETSYTFQGLNDDQIYSAKVIAKTDKGGTAAVTQELMTKPAGQPLPDFQISVSEIDTQGAMIQWDQVIAENQSSVTYHLYMDGNLVAGDLTDNQYLLSGLNQNTTYTVLIVAKAKGHPSSENQTSFKTLDPSGN